MRYRSPATGCILLGLSLLAGCGGGSSRNEASHHDVTLTWDASKSAAHYNVYRSEISDGYFGLIGSTAKLSFTDQNVDPGATYYYVCTAVDSEGRESGYSNEVQATIPSP